MRKSLSLSLLISSALFANPSDPVVIEGSASFQQLNAQTCEILTSDRAIIEWKDFSIGKNETTRFVQPSITSSVLNRVTDSPTQILGQLEANGQVYLINPNGIVFGEHSAVNTASFIASTLDVQNDAFLANDNITFTGASSETIVNLGKIQSENGDIFLFAHQVENHGSIQSQNGTVGVSGCDYALLKPAEKDHLFIKTKESFSSAEAEENPFALAFEPEKSSTLITGEIQAIYDDGTGGKIIILADEIQIRDEALLDASNLHGNGEILIGGEYQGKEEHFQNADYLLIDENVQVHADALESGPGGKIIFWSDEATGFFGTATAKGGALNGDGGFIEISSKGLLCPDGYVDTTASFGKTGTLLLDPTDVTIDTPGNSGISVFPPPGYTFNNANATISTIVGPTLIGLLAANDVTINTSNAFGGTGTISVPLTGTFTWASGRRLTMIADTSITFLGNVSSSNLTLPDNQTVLDLRAPTITVGNAAGGVDVTVSCSSGRIDLQAPTSLNLVGGTGSPNRGTLQSSGDINIFNTGDINILGGSGLVSSATLQSFSGNIDINMSGNLNLMGGSNASTNAVINVLGGDVDITMTGANTMCTIMAGTGGGAPASIASPNPGNNISFTMTGANSHLVINGGTGGNTFAGFLIGTTGNITCNITGDYFMNGGASVGNGQAIFFCTNAGEINLTGRNYFLTGGFGPAGGVNDAQITTTSGDVTINATGQMMLTGGTPPNATARIETFGSNLNIFIATDLTMTNGALIENLGIGELNIVVDNQFPSPPLFGGGRIIMDASSSITAASGPLRIYTSQQHLNSIGGMLNGISFNPGSIFVNTNQEQWGAYYPSTFGGVLFTVFYKDTLVQVAQRAAIVGTEYLHNESSFPYSLGWMEMFWVQLYGQNGETYREPYYIRRPEDVEAINNPKSYTDIIE